MTVRVFDGGMHSTKGEFLESKTAARIRKKLKLHDTYGLNALDNTLTTANKGSTHKMTFNDRYEALHSDAIFDKARKRL